MREIKVRAWDKEKKVVLILSVVALVVSLMAIGIVIHKNISISQMAYGNRVYRYETLALSGTVQRADWFAGGTMVYYYKNGEESLSWTEIPWRMNLADLNKGDIITVVKQYKVEYVVPFFCETCGLIVDTKIKSVEVQEGQNTIS